MDVIRLYTAYAYITFSLTRLRALAQTICLTDYCTSARRHAEHTPRSQLLTGLYCPHFPCTVHATMVIESQLEQFC